MSQVFGIAEAKTKFTSIIEMVMMGEEVHITKNGKPVAKLVAESTGKRELGQCSEMLKVVGNLKDPNDDFSEFYK